MEIIVDSEEKMLSLGKNLADALEKTGVKLVELTGDVGSGKTTLTRGLARGLGVKSEVTSPSFTISKSYAGSSKILVHYDFYRLAEPGLMAEDLSENLENSENIIVLEWAETVADILPEDRIKIEIKMNDDGSRTVIVPKILEGNL